MPENVQVLCPCCDTLLTVDPETGAVLREERPTKREHKSLEEAIGSVKAQKRDAELRLTRAMEEAKHREQILERKFEEARKKAAENPDERPPGPFDGD